MNETILASQESIKVLPNDEVTPTGCRIVSSKDALESGLPENCTVIQMKVLEKPERIKRRRHN
jgi:hypothetical protein